MRWPSPQDYREAIQIQSVSIGDEELRNGELLLDALQLPLVNSGQYAAVFKILGGEKSWAVRCFLHNFPDRQERYKKISQFVLKDDLEYTVDFELLDKGILVGSDWFPLLKMEYVSGLSFGRYVRENIKNGEKLADLLEQFKAMMQALKENGIAHGDLQHDNIVVTDDGSLRLIDYDGMFVPDLKGWHSNELGHRNYQHPQRTELDFGPELDNFSAWLICGALDCLIADPRSHGTFIANEEAFFLTREDFISSDSSNNLHELESLGGRCKEFSKQIRTLVRQSCSALPFLGQKLEIDRSLRAVDTRKLPLYASKKNEIDSVSSSRAVIRIAPSDLPNYSIEQLKYSMGDLESFPGAVVGQFTVSTTSDRANKQEFIKKITENFHEGETLLWTGGLSPVKLSTGRQNFNSSFLVYTYIWPFLFACCFGLTVFTHVPVFMMFGVVAMLLAITGFSGDSSGEQQVYVLTEKNLKIGICSNFRLVETPKMAWKADMICVDVPLKQVKLARFHKGSESLEERVELRVEVPSKDYKATKLRSLWLHGFTTKERQALLTRLRSLGVQCFIPS